MSSRRRVSTGTAPVHMGWRDRSVGTGLKQMMARKLAQCADAYPGYGAGAAF